MLTTSDSIVSLENSRTTIDILDDEGLFKVSWELALYNIALIVAEAHLSFPDDQYVHEYNYRVSFCFAIIGDVKIEPGHISAVLYLRDGTGTYKQVQSLD